MTKLLSLKEDVFNNTRVRYFYDDNHWFFIPDILEALELSIDSHILSELPPLSKVSKFSTDFDNPNSFTEEGILKAGFISSNYVHYLSILTERPLLNYGFRLWVFVSFIIPTSMVHFIFRGV